MCVGFQTDGLQFSPVVQSGPVQFCWRSPPVRGELLLSTVGPCVLKRTEQRQRVDAIDLLSEIIFQQLDFIYTLSR